MAKKTLYRSRTNKVVGGVCGGVAEYLNIDPTVVRLLWVFATLAWGFGVIAYIACMFIMPEEPAGKKKEAQAQKPGVSEAEGMKIAGIVMLFVGSVFLANNLGLFSMLPWFSWGLVWSLIIIGIGVILLIAPKNKGCC